LGQLLAILDPNHPDDWMSFGDGVLLLTKLVLQKFALLAANAFQVFRLSGWWVFTRNICAEHILVDGGFLLKNVYAFDILSFGSLAANGDIGTFVLLCVSSHIGKIQ